MCLADLKHRRETCFELLIIHMFIVVGHHHPVMCRSRCIWSHFPFVKYLWGYLKQQSGPVVCSESELKVIRHEIFTLLPLNLCRLMSVHVKAACLCLVDHFGRQKKEKGVQLVSEKPLKYQIVGHFCIKFSNFIQIRY